MVCALKVNPGEHNFTIYCDGDRVGARKTKFFSKPRVDKVPLLQNQRQKAAKFKKFNKDKSAFSGWRDDEMFLENLVRHDLKNWNLSKVVRDDNDRVVCEKLIRKHAKQLKDVFVALCSRNETYPKLAWKSLLSFLDQCKLLDEPSELKATATPEHISICFAQTIAKDAIVIREDQLPIKLTVLEREKYKAKLQL